MFRRLCILPCIALLLVVTSPAYGTVNVEPETADPEHEADVEHFDAALKQSDENQWWAVAAVNEWNKAVARNEQARAESAARRVAPSPRRVAGSAPSGSGEVNGHPCGGALPACYILQRESHGTNAENPSSSASGYWQFIDGTWNGYGGYSHASDAPAEVQDAKAAEVWAGGAGASHWRCC